MATTVFMLSSTDSSRQPHRGTNTAKLDGSTSGWIPYALSTSRGSSSVGVTDTSNTVAGSTSGVEIANAAVVPIEWISPPIDAAVTISGAITLNLWAFENNMSANVAINAVVDKLAAVDGTITQIVKSARVTELGTSAAAENFTATPGAGVALSKGDRIRVRVFGDDAGTMATGFTFTFQYSRSSAGVVGDSFVTFTETFGFQTTDPSGTKLYARSTASDVGTASTVDREMWTTAGAAGVTLSTNTATGWTLPIQMTDTAGGTVAEWFSRRLQAFTLAGLAKLVIRAFESAAAANASARVEVASVDNDGTNASVWGTANLEAVTTSGSVGELATSAANRNCWVSGADLAISTGQRLRLRVFVDDCGDVPLVTGSTASLSYNTSDTLTTWLQLEQTVSEFTTSLAVPQKNASRTNRDFDPWSVTGWM